jgi:N-acetylglucosaminyldiphosphoundecaprenol N-acetyl-beta-D-mannosaminyltransferase
MEGQEIHLLGVGVDSISRQEILMKISQTVQEESTLLIAHANVHGINQAYEQPWLRAFYNQADLVYCDGMGVKLGARLLGYEIRERYTLADWVWELAAMCTDQQISLFLLGNPPGVAEKASQKLQERYKELEIKGVGHGYFEKSPASQENAAVIERINALQPDILLVGFGMPLQERWLFENWTRLDVRVAITCGALFEYLSGDLKRGPKWMTDYYLEWLVRAVITPQRYAGRYLHDIPLFFYRILRQRIYGKPDLFR